VLGVENEQELIGWQHDLVESGVTCAAFVEPDMGDQRTALAVHPGTDCKMFKDLYLL
jgi:hypothetical protein